jgi:putative sugar O-methyltransferase
VLNLNRLFRYIISRLDLESNSESLVEVQEMQHLRPLLESLPDRLKIAIDIGAHKGSVTRTLAHMGFKVYALEPHPQTRRRLIEELNDLIRSGRVEVFELAASDCDGAADMFVGSADTLNTLESAWTTRAFPEYFREKHVIRVQTRKLSSLLTEHGLRSVGFLKIDAEGHETHVLKGLFDNRLGLERPALIMFEANQRFPEKAEECLAILLSQGYKEFDIFVKEGTTLLAAARFSGARLPKVWREYGKKYFYSNIIAYYSELLSNAVPPAPSISLQQEQLERSRNVLQQALDMEKKHPIAVHGEWERARLSLREYILRQDFDSFLQHPVCRTMFFRTGWGAGQDHEVSALLASKWGRKLVEDFIEPPIGKPDTSPKLANVSVNMLGMMYYLLRLRLMYGHDWPRSVIEVGGGYGAFSYLFCHEGKNTAYGIVDLPEMLALQHYFLSLVLPDRVVRLATAENVRLCEGEIILVPVSLVGKCHLQADLFFSTFGFSEMPRALQIVFEKQNFFEARTIFVTGQLSDEAPELGWVPHSELAGSIMRHFAEIRIERFHIGKNYLLEAKRKS